MFHLDVLKVDLGVAHVVNSYACMFQSYASSVSSVLDVCYKCFIWTFSK
jgi:hypothetical protein